MKYSGLQTNWFLQPHLPSWMGVDGSMYRIIVCLKLNEMSKSAQNIEWIGVSIKRLLARNFMKCTDLHSSHVCKPPPPWRIRVGQFPKKVIAINCNFHICS